MLPNDEQRIKEIKANIADWVMVDGDPIYYGIMSANDQMQSHLRDIAWLVMLVEQQAGIIGDMQSESLAYLRGKSETLERCIEIIRKNQDLEFDNRLKGGLVQLLRRAVW